MQDSLPAAGPALPGGIGYPQGSCERFHGCNDSPFPSFLARCQFVFSREKRTDIAPRNLGKEDETRTQKPFIGTLRVNESRPVEPGQQPEASLAWGERRLPLRSVDSQCPGRAIEP